MGVFALKAASGSVCNHISSSHIASEPGTGQYRSLVASDTGATEDVYCLKLKLQTEALYRHNIIILIYLVSCDKILNKLGVQII